MPLTKKLNFDKCKMTTFTPLFKCLHKASFVVTIVTTKDAYNLRMLDCTTIIIGDEFFMA